MVQKVYGMKIKNSFLFLVLAGEMCNLQLSPDENSNFRMSYHIKIEHVFFGFGGRNTVRFECYYSKAKSKKGERL